MLKFCLALACHHPCYGVFRIRINGDVRVMFELPCQRVDDGTKFTYIIGSLFIGACANVLLSCLCDPTPILWFTGGAVASRSHTNGWKHRLCAGGVPRSVRH